MSRALVFALALVAVGAKQVPTPDPVPRFDAEFPPQDQALAWDLRDGATKRLARDRIAVAPNDSETIRILGRARDTDGLLRCLRRIVGTNPRALPDALEAAGDAWTDFRGNDERSLRKQEMLRQLIADARGKLPGLARDDAARAERVLIGIENGLPPWRRDWPAPLRRFVEQYRGTDAAVLAEVDIISAAPVSQRQLDDLDAFAAAHPGTVAAAKALYLKGFQLQFNAIGTIEPRGADPTDRLLRLHAIAQELQSGRYPECEWVRKARDLVIQFFYPKEMKIPPASIERILDTYTAFVQAHFVVDESFPEQNGVGYLITRKMADLYDRRGDRMGGMEHLFAQLESRADSRPTVRYLRAMFYLRPADSPSKELLDAARGKAIETLTALAAEGDGLWSRKALATLAMIDFIDGRYDAAARELASYADKYPKSEWAWVAMIRKGQAEEARDDPAAATSYLKAAQSFERVPPARVLGHEYAARVLETRGRLDDAVGEHRRALEGWDDAYGVKYSIHTPKPAGADPFAVPTDPAEVERPALAARIAQLKQSLAAAGGAQVEHGRVLLGKGRYDAAANELEDLIKRYPRSRAAAEARYLAHRARLERALTLADAERPESDRRASLSAFETLSREPVDFPVTAARIARASLMWIDGTPDEAEYIMRNALTEYRAAQTPTKLDTALERDIAAIRAATFLPRGGGVYGSQHWNAFTWPGGLPPFAVLKSDVTVKLPGGEVTRVNVVQPLPGIEQAIFFTTDELALMQRMLSSLGGRKRRIPTAVMETPNQPVGASMEILQLWNKFFPGRPGHWFGWEIETYPIITQIEFTNPERTRAAASVTVGYSGGVVELEKQKSTWIAKRLTSWWIT